MQKRKRHKNGMKNDTIVKKEHHYSFESKIWLRFFVGNDVGIIPIVKIVKITSREFKS